MAIKKFIPLFILLTSIAFVSAEERESVVFVYDGKNLSFGNLTKEAPPGNYEVKIISLKGEVIESYEIIKINELPQTFNVFFPDTKDGILYNVYYPDGTLMFPLVSRNVSEEDLKRVQMSLANETTMKENEEKQKSTETWFIRLIIASIIIVGIMVFYVWKYKMPRN